MKLKNKLIPLVAFATTATVVAPLVTMTSCNQENATTFDFIGKDKDFEYSGKTITVTDLTIDTATAAFETVAKEGDLLTQELAAHAYENYLSYANWVENWGEFTEYTVKFINPRIGSTTIYYPGEEPTTYPTISFKKVATIKYNGEWELDGVTNYGEYEETWTLEYENVPFMAYANDDSTGITNYKKWYIGLTGILWSKQDYIFQYMTDNWSFKGTKDYKYTEWTEKTEGKKYTWSDVRSVSIDSFKKFYSLETYLNEQYVIANNPSVDEIIRYKAQQEIDDYKYLLFCDFQSNYLYLAGITPEIIAYEPYVTGLRYSTTTETEFKVLITGFYLQDVPETTTGWKLDYTDKVTLPYIGSDKDFSGFTLNFAKDAAITIVPNVDDDGAEAYISATINAPVGKTITLEKLTKSLLFRLPRTLSIVDGDGQKQTIITENTTIASSVGSPIALNKTVTSFVEGSSVALAITNTSNGANYRVYKPTKITIGGVTVIAIINDDSNVWKLVLKNSDELTPGSYTVPANTYISTVEETPNGLAYDYLDLSGFTFTITA